jgi:hypothetical protein
MHIAARLAAAVIFVLCVPLAFSGIAAPSQEGPAIESTAAATETWTKYDLPDRSSVSVPVSWVAKPSPTETMKVSESGSIRTTLQALAVKPLRYPKDTSSVTVALDYVYDGRSGERLRIDAAAFGAFQAKALKFYGADDGDPLPHKPAALALEGRAAILYTLVPADAAAGGEYLILGLFYAGDTYYSIAARCPQSDADYWTATVTRMMKDWQPAKGLAPAKK